MNTSEESEVNKVNKTDGENLEKRKDADDSESDYDDAKSDTATIVEDNPCGKCKELVLQDDKGIGCEVCNHWFHIKCVNVTVTKYKFFMKESDAHWFCPSCNLAAKKLHQEVVVLKAENAEIKEKLRTLDIKISDVETSIEVKVNAAKDTVKEELTKDIETMETSVTNKSRKEFAETVTKVISTEKEKIKTEIQAELKTQNEDDLTQNPNVASFAEITAANLETTKTEVAKQLTELAPNLFREEYEEKERRVKKKNNLIIFNVPEPNRGEDAADLTSINEIIQRKLKLNTEIDNAIRLGSYNQEKRRPIKVTLTDIDTKKKILSKATTLRDLKEDDPYYKVYIRPDLTKMQLQQSKNLYEELKSIREVYPDITWKISKGQITRVNPTPENPVNETNQS